MRKVQIAFNPLIETIFILLPLRLFLARFMFPARLLRHLHEMAPGQMLCEP